MTWWKKEYEHRPLRPGEDPAAEDLGNAELVNSAGLQNVVSVFGFTALLILPVAWVLGKLKERRAARRS